MGADWRHSLGFCSPTFLGYQAGYPGCWFSRVPFPLRAKRKQRRWAMPWLLTPKSCGAPWLWCVLPDPLVHLGWLAPFPASWVCSVITDWRKWPSSGSVWSYWSAGSESLSYHCVVFVVGQAPLHRVNELVGAVECPEFLILVPLCDELEVVCSSA